MSVSRTVTGARVARRRPPIEPHRLNGNPVPKASTRTRVARIVRRVHRWHAQAATARRVHVKLAVGESLVVLLTDARGAS
jgi:hypothetical protein